ncbi:hypothetical protein BE17_50955 [Sorangium cellulosum]|uniref:Uncharacterized protein n=1 Tax=Sorangium cellulosum TaxID=56 RepID=A0A150RSF0_SORCE|nr:hypothetical protein BE17_50955 [Sorangium cellulosum]
MAVCSDSSPKLIAHATQSFPSQSSSSVLAHVSAAGVTSPEHASYPEPSCLQTCVPALQIPTSLVPEGPE